jgi:hypothetical protein
MTNEDWTELMESITGPTEGESIGLNTEDLKKKMSDYYGEYFESVKTSYSEALHNALENSGSEETLSTFMQQYMQDQMADFDFSTVMENYGPISNEYFCYAAVRVADSRYKSRNITQHGSVNESYQWLGGIENQPADLS